MFGWTFLASLCVPTQDLSVSLFLLGVKKGVQLPLLVNKSLERWWEVFPPATWEWEVLWKEARSLLAVS